MVVVKRLTVARDVECDVSCPDLSDTDHLFGCPLRARSGGPGARVDSLQSSWLCGENVGVCLVSSSFLMGETCVLKCLNLPFPE